MVLLRTADAARRLGVSSSFLEKARVNGSGPSYVKSGRAVAYRDVDMDAWVASLVRQSTIGEGVTSAAVGYPLRLLFCLPSSATSRPETDSLDRNGMMLGRPSWGGRRHSSRKCRRKSTRLNLTAVMVIHQRAVIAQWGDTTKRDRGHFGKIVVTLIAGARSIR